MLLWKTDGTGYSSNRLTRAVCIGGWHHAQFFAGLAGRPGLVAGGNVAGNNIKLHVLLIGESHVGRVAELRVAKARLRHQDATENKVAAIPIDITGSGVPARECRDRVFSWRGDWKLNTLICKIIGIICSGIKNSINSRVLIGSNGSVVQDSRYSGAKFSVVWSSSVQ